MMNFNSALIEKAKNAKSAEELCEIAKQNDVELSTEAAAAYFEQLHPKCGELDDDELDSVAGGACSGESGVPTCPKCGSALTQVWYADPDLNNYALCYGCGNYGLWHSGNGTKELPEMRAQYLVEKTTGQ